ncbi:hypothetical protein VNI00_010354 [Paramarasmius palmivorus]|uniref:Uncharacterized protein n=1 Tax=Paramarasmius palmivorus TaxID=297713 RepID=A0AAW0CGA6_9AGAR
MSTGGKPPRKPLKPLDENNEPQKVDPPAGATDENSSPKKRRKKAPERQDREVLKRRSQRLKSDRLAKMEIEQSMLDIETEEARSSDEDMAEPEA